MGTYDYAIQPWWWHELLFRAIKTDFLSQSKLISVTNWARFEIQPRDTNAQKKIVTWEICIRSWKFHAWRTPNDRRTYCGYTWKICNLTPTNEHFNFTTKGNKLLAVRKQLLSSQTKEDTERQNLSYILSLTRLTSNDRPYGRLQ